MRETTWRRWVIGGLLALGVAVFGAGIDWGLPSHQIDPLLFGSGVNAATNSPSAYQLSGAWIDRLAGDWGESGTIGADVAVHPITDRSRPVTLLENRRGMTADELIQRGDSKLAALVAAADAADRALAKARQADEGEEQINSASNRAFQAQRAVGEYVGKYNQKHFPGLTEAIKRDDVSRAGFCGAIGSTAISRTR